MSIIDWFTAQKKAYEEEERKRRKAEQDAYEKLRKSRQDAKAKKASSVSSYKKSENKTYEAEKRKVTNYNKKVTSKNKEIEKKAATYKAKEWEEAKDKLKNQSSKDYLNYSNNVDYNSLFKSVSKKAEDNQYNKILSQREKLKEEPEKYSERITGGEKVNALFPELREPTIEKLAQRRENENLAKNFGEEIRKDENYEKLVEEGNKTKPTYTEAVTIDWGLKIDNKDKAFSNVSQDRLDELAAVKAKYGERSKEYKLAYKQVLYEGEQAYNEKEAQNISFSNADLVKYGYTKGLRSTGEGLKSAVGAYSSTSFNPAVKSETDIAFERDLEKAPIATQLATIGTMGLGQVSSMFTTALLTGSPALSMAFMGFGSAGNAYDEALSEGKQHEEALQYATMIGTSEIALTQVLGVFKYVPKVGLKGLGTELSEAISASVRMPKISSLLVYLRSSLKEGLEEYSQEIIEPAFRNFAFDENNKIKPFTIDALIAGIAGMLLGGIANLPSLDMPTIRIENQAKQIEKNRIKEQDAFIEDMLRDTTEDMSTEELAVFSEAVQATNIILSEKEMQQRQEDTSEAINSAEEIKEQPVEPLKELQSEEKTQTDTVNQEEEKTAENTQDIIGKYENASTENINTEEVKQDFERLNASLNEEKNAERFKYVEEELAKKEIEGTFGKNVKDNFNYQKKEAETLQRKIYTHIEEGDFVDSDLKQVLLNNPVIKNYVKTTNAAQKNEAYDKLVNAKSINAEISRWLNTSSEQVSDIDLVEGMFIVKMYEGLKEYDLANLVAEHLSRKSTATGRALQVLSMMNKLNPRTKLAAMEQALTKAKQDYRKNQSLFGKDLSKDKNLKKFNLTKEEKRQILEWAELQTNTDDADVQNYYEQRIQELVFSKMPASWRAQLRQWTRISMLLNPKTLFSRNFGSNVINVPIKHTTDLFATAADRMFYNNAVKRLQKDYPDIKPVKTTGTNLKGTGSAWAQGSKRVVSDYKNKTDTRLVKTDKSEIGNQYKKSSNIEALNKVDRFTTFLIKLGDNGFNEMYYMKSLNNQLKANNTSEITDEMKAIATWEAEEATWQSNNGLTRTISRIVNTLNGGKEYGIGTILQPFVRTPANLVRMMVQLSPAGFAIAANDTVKFTNSLEKGVYNPVLQKKAADAWGKAIVGTLMTVGAFLLNQAGLLTGGEDDDKDVANFEKFVLGKMPYSVKVGDRYYNYSWAQPVGSSIAMGVEISSNFKKYLEDGSSKDDALWETIKKSTDAMTKALSDGSNLLFEQSLFTTLRTFIESDNYLFSFLEIAAQLPIQATPTILSQTAQSIDDTLRQTYDKNSLFKTTINRIQAKMPNVFAEWLDYKGFNSTELAPQLTTLGKEIKRYDGKDNGVVKHVINIFLNPATEYSSKSSPAADEIYNLYMSTNDKTILPRTAPYTTTYKDENGIVTEYTMTTEERAEYQKITGKGVNDAVTSLLKNSEYKSLSSDKKIDVINKVMDYYNLQATRYIVENNGGTYEYAQPVNLKTYSVEQSGVNVGNYMLYKSEIDKLSADINENGNQINGSRKEKVIKYINSLNIKGKQRLLIYATEYGLNDYEEKTIKDYVKTLDLTQSEKDELLSKFKYLKRE